MRAQPEVDAQRYARHLVLPELGVEGQRRLLAASVLVVGAGGLGSPVLLYLAAAGVGHLGVADFDRVEVSNLQRQVLFEDRDVGQEKARLATERVRALNPGVKTTTHSVRVSPENARDLVRGYDLVLDGTDNFAARYALNDACVAERKVLISATVHRFEGQVTVLGAPGGPCYRCLFPEPPPPGMIPDCAEGGVVGAVPGVIGSLQATETIKWITGAGRPLTGRLVIVDTLAMRFQTISFERDPDCPVCGDRPREAVQPAGACTTVPLLTVAELAAMMAKGEPLLVLDVREPGERTGGEPPSTLLPLSELESASLPPLPSPTAPVVVFCRSGARSARAVTLLRARGYDPVYSLAGGMLAWEASSDRSTSATS